MFVCETECVSSLCAITEVKRCTLGYSFPRCKECDGETVHGKYFQACFNGI